MLSRHRRARAAGAAAGLAVLLLSGCGDEPVRAGAAAIVGEERIETDTLQDVVDRGLSSPEAQQQFGGDRADFQRQVLNRLVRAELLEDAARENGIEVTQGDVDAQLADFAEQAGGRDALEEQAAAGGISPVDLPRFAREVVLELRLADELTEDVEVPQEQLASVYEQARGQFETARSRHILVADEAQARDLLAQLQADPDRFAELAAQFSTDDSNKDDGGDLGRQGRGTFVPAFDEAVFTQPLNTPTVVQTEFGWHVVEVLERDVTTLAQATPELRRQVLGEQREQAVGEALRAAAERLEVTVNPRFGQWDAELVEVVPAPAGDGLSSPEPEAGTGSVPGPATGTVEEGAPAPSNSPAS